MNKDAQGRRKVERSESNWKCGISWDDWPEIRKDLFRQFRSPMGEEMVLRDNFFLETIQTRMLRNLTEKEMDTTVRLKVE